MEKQFIREINKDVSKMLFNDHYQNSKNYNIPRAQLIIADIPYNLGNNAYASNPSWYIDGDNSLGESENAGKQFFDTDKNFSILDFFHFCTRLLKKESKETKQQVFAEVIRLLDS